MSWIVFENEGVLDPVSIKTFGISVKESENPIGFFGTGLKYAIAILTRQDQEIKILSGNRTFEFKSKTLSVRGKDFSVITMNGEELPFTTELGKNWEVWQAFRELYCNALDEGGSCDSRMFLPETDENKTFVCVKGREFTSAFHERDSIVLSLPNHLMVGSGEVQVFNKVSEYIYYRGIRVLKTERPCLLTYNIKDDLELTEDRTVKSPSSALSKIPRAIAALKDKTIIKQVLTADRRMFEQELSFSSIDFWQERISAEFDEVLETEFGFNNDHLNKSARDYLVKKKNKSALKNYEEESLTTVEKKQLDRCKDIILKLYPDFQMYKILVVKNLGQTTMALADFNDRKIVISKRSFDMGTKFLLSTLIEEYFHLKTGYADCSRELQTFLFDSYCGIIENHVLQEPI